MKLELMQSEYISKKLDQGSLSPADAKGIFRGNPIIAMAYTRQHITPIRRTTCLHSHRRVAMCDICQYYRGHFPVRNLFIVDCMYDNLTTDSMKNEQQESHIADISKQPTFDVKTIKQMDESGTEQCAVIIDGKEMTFYGRYYERMLEPETWQYGVCSVCGNLSGRTSVVRTDYCFCLEHRDVWVSGSNCFSEYREEWYTEDVAQQNMAFLRVVSGRS